MSVLLCAVLVTVVPWLSVKANEMCPMSNITVQPDFDVDRFMGTWYEISWIPENWFPPEFNFQDFVVLYEQTNDSFIQADSYGRQSGSSASCFHGSDGLVLTDVPGKFMYDRIKNTTTGERFQSDYWVIDTDYDIYALVFGCRGRDDQDACVLPDGWLWARQTQLSGALQAQVEAKMMDICLQPEQFMATQHNNPCPLPSGGTTHFACPAVSVTAAALGLLLFLET